MSARWQRRRVLDNDGKPMWVWADGDYEISENVPRLQAGRLVGWDFETTVRLNGMSLWARVGVSPTLAGAKRMATLHARETR